MAMPPPLKGQQSRRRCLLCGRLTLQFDRPAESGKRFLQNVLRVCRQSLEEAGLQKKI